MNFKKLSIYTLLVISTIILILFITKTNKQSSEEKVSEKTPIKKPAEEKKEEVIEFEEVKTEPKALERTEIWKEIDTKIASGNPYRKQEAIETLVTIGDAESIKIIEKLTEDKTPSVVNRALNALGELKSEESIPLINEIYNTNNIRQDGFGESIRINAVNALGDIGSQTSVDMLGTELSKKNITMGNYVVDALQKINSKKSIPYLEEYKAFLDEQLANMPGADEIGEYRYIWEQSAKQVTEAINKIKDSKQTK